MFQVRNKKEMHVKYSLFPISHLHDHQTSLWEEMSIYYLCSVSAGWAFIKAYRIVLNIYQID